MNRAPAPPTRPLPVPRPSVRRLREVQAPVVYGILSIVLILALMQLWLLTATMNADLGGDRSIAWPALSASVVCLILNVGLLRYLYLPERSR